MYLEAFRHRPIIARMFYYYHYLTAQGAPLHVRLTICEVAYGIHFHFTDKIWRVPEKSLKDLNAVKRWIWLWLPTWNAQRGRMCWLFSCNAIKRRKYVVQGELSLFADKKVNGLMDWCAGVIIFKRVLRGRWQMWLLWIWFASARLASLIFDNWLNLCVRIKKRTLCFVVGNSYGWSALGFFMGAPYCCVFSWLFFLLQFTNLQSDLTAVINNSHLDRGNSCALASSWLLLLKTIQLDCILVNWCMCNRSLMKDEKVLILKFVYAVTLNR